MASLGTAALSAGSRLADEGFLVGVISPPGALETSLVAASRHDPRVGRLDRDGMSRAVTIVPAPLAKGLEFDAVAVVEPASIATGDLRGLRLLYVALTRPIQRLTIVHSLPLPEVLR